jgi:hypothetical protein
MQYESAQDLFDALCAPFAAEEIDWRVGSTTADKSKGMALAYIDARAAMDRFDSACGIDGWACNYQPNGQMMLCNVGVRMPNGEWVWKADGAGATDVEGEKGMLSDAFKRAAVKFGVGRYLYSMDSPWIEIEPAGPKSHRIKKDERKKLDECHDKAAQRVGWGGPMEVPAYRLLVRVVQETITQASDAESFRERHKGMIPQLRVGMRRHFEGLLGTIGAHREAAE